jgi:hypothetical protein
MDNGLHGTRQPAMKPSMTAALGLFSSRATRWL